jgi:hypothetical protein
MGATFELRSPCLHLLHLIQEHQATQIEAWQGEPSIDQDASWSPCSFESSPSPARSPLFFRRYPFCRTTNVDEKPPLLESKVKKLENGMLNEGINMQLKCSRLSLTLLNL